MIKGERGMNGRVVGWGAGERVGFEAKGKSPLASAGRARVDVALLVNGKIREVVPVFYEITATDPEGGADIGPGIRPASYTAPAIDPREFLVKSRDPVKIVANIGTARLEAVGEALQDGRAGQAIRARNSEP